MELTHEEIGVLIEALEAWKNKDMAGEIMFGIVAAMVTKDDEQAAAFAEKQKAKELSKEIEKGRRNEEADLLKAKLIQIRRALPVRSEV